MENFKLREAVPGDADTIWRILQQAIERRRLDGSRQWQDGYPNYDIVQSDLQRGIGHVFVDSDKIAAYCAIILSNEPAYENIEGKWLSDEDSLIIHRVAVAEEFAGRGVVTRLFQELENYAVQKNVSSIKLDTNFDNAAMLRILQKLDYSYCGEIMLKGGQRRAYEKILQHS